VEHLSYLNNGRFIVLILYGKEQTSVAHYWTDGDHFCQSVRGPDINDYIDVIVGYKSSGIHLGGAITEKFYKPSFSLIINSSRTDLTALWVNVDPKV